jgi:predicted amidohydrolase YtcJ
MNALLLAVHILYLNGSVLTMDSRASKAEAVAVRDGKIEAVGTNADLRKLASPSTQIVDLKGRVLTPGFYAAHDHFPQSGIVALFQVDLNSPPMGTMRTIEDIVTALRERAARTPKGEWIVGRGYDDTLLTDHRHPTTADLDRASPDHPILVIHTSGHARVGNSRALVATGSTPAAPPVTAQQRGQAALWAERQYFARGVTTAVIAGASPMPKTRLRLLNMDGTRAVKIWHDGSIQASSGYLSQPYFQHGDPAHRGRASRTRAELLEMVRKHHRAGRQVAIHGNGDAAIEEILHVFAEVQREHPRTDARHRIEHCQTVREDQLDRIKELGITPSFFVAHVYYWGDRHRDIFLGPERASRISPLASALKRGIRFTIHDDTPVTPVNPLLSVWTAVNRRTRAGKELGPEQKIAAVDALRAVTSDAAWQNFEEKHKGSIEPGKLADFVILDRNPLDIPPMQIREVRVLETIIGGVRVWPEPKPPYAPSPVISGVTFDWSTHKRHAQGSDNFQLTWGADDHQYGAWGDGGGFGGTNSDGRVSLGVARIEGSWDNYRGVNVWGGKNAVNPANVDGKSWGMISVGGVLYMWVSPGSPLAIMQREVRLYSSKDFGANWTPAPWAFTREDDLTIPTICQFGKDYSGARDGYVYHYFIHPRDETSDSGQRPGTIYLARSPKDRLLDRGAYEFYAGQGWSSDVTRKQPVFEDRHNGVGWVMSVSYNAGLKRYLLMTDHTISNRGNLGIFDAPEPWGPWTTALFLNEADGSNFGTGHVEPNTFFWNMPTKWQSADGRDFTLVFTGSGRGRDNDSFNLIRGRFELRK